MSSVKPDFVSFSFVLPGWRTPVSMFFCLISLSVLFSQETPSLNQITIIFSIPQPDHFMSCYLIWCFVLMSPTHEFIFQMQYRSMWHWVLVPISAGRSREVTRLCWATGSPGPTGPLEWLGFIYKLTINIWPSFILIHSFLAQMEWILNLVGQGHPHTACLAFAAKLFFILQGE